MRKLASIKEITEIMPIEGKDRIVLATVDGWSVIVQKADYAVGDKVVYCEIDSVLPEKPEFEFLRSKNFRIKTMKMAGVISQGICFPLSILPDGDYNIDDDVTDIIGVTQYEETQDIERTEPTKNHKKSYLMRFAWYRKLFLNKTKAADGFPSFIHKTDEIRIQNIPTYLNLDVKWIATEKVDGSSGTFALKKVSKKHFWNKTKYEFYVCSRNRRLCDDDGSAYWSVANDCHIQEILKELIGDNDWVAIQGEVIGPKIQKNKYKSSNYHLYVFNYIDSKNGRWNSVEAKNLMEEKGLSFVPIIDEAMDLKGKTVSEVLEIAHGESQLHKTLREGIVFRSQDGKQSFKAVDPLFLLKYDE